ncbi:hypothetical protein HY971_00535 [Candidatus Kaiserbacteria bacterium]|nr:hypothetical protein [Candidatus Kaiserbacteria bacterium]
MRVRIGALLGVFAFLPFFVFAATSAVPAGFATGSLWFSKTEVVAGETLKIYTVVYDSSTSAIEGDVVFNVDTKEIGTQHFKLAAGETQILSSAWTATGGTHTFGASLRNVTGVSGTIANVETNSVSIKVAEAVPSPLSQYTNTVTNIIASSTPVVTNIAQSFYGMTESVRQGAVEALKRQLAASEGLRAQVLGTSTSQTSRDATDSPNEKSASILGSLWRGALSTLLFICNLRVLFYGLLLFVVFVLYKLLRTWMRERRAHSY